MVTKTDSSLIVHDGGTIKDVLDTAKPIANYTALRAYTGSASQIRITSNGIAGFFYYDAADTTSADNEGTVIVANNGKRWKRLFDGAVSVKWFGAKGDWNGTTGTDDSPAVIKAIAALFSSGANTLFYPDGWYYFSSPVTVLFNTFRGLRFVGTSAPGFTGIRPGGTRITGAAGLESLFIFTKTTTTTWGGYSFETTNIDYDGNSNGVGSAFINKVAGAPARPFNVYSCNFRSFQKAISSDISAAGLTTGIGQINIEGCNFQGNQLALYGKGQSALSDLRFIGNVCEQNTVGGIFTEANALSGTLQISDNLLEGQPDAIKINAGKCTGSITRNYFESNTGDLIYFLASNGSSVLDIGENYYLNSAGTKVFISGGTVHVRDNFVEPGVKLDVVNVTPRSKINNLGQLNPRVWGGRTYALDLSSAPIKTNVPPTALDSGSYIDIGSVVEDTPIGICGFAQLSGNSSVRATQATLLPGDAIVATCLMRIVSGSPTITLNVYDSSNGYLTNTPVTGPFPSRIEIGKWFIVAATAKVSAGSIGAARLVWGIAGGTMDVSKTFTYKISAPVDASTSLYLHLPYFSPLFGSVTYDPPSLADGASNNTSVTVTGAALGDFVDSVSFSNDLQGVAASAWVSAANTVSVRFRNNTGSVIDLPSGTLKVRVTKI